MLISGRCFGVRKGQGWRMQSFGYWSEHKWALPYFKSLRTSRRPQSADDFCVLFEKFETLSRCLWFEELGTRPIGASGRSSSHLLQENLLGCPCPWRGSRPRQPPLMWVLLAKRTPEPFPDVLRLKRRREEPFRLLHHLRPSNMPPRSADNGESNAKENGKLD